MILLFIPLLLITIANAQVKVLSPEKLASEFRVALHGEPFILGSTATFGSPTYGESFTALLLYQPSKSMYCTDDYKEIQAKASEYKLTLGLRTIFLVERGGDCTFVQKALIAQSLGADGVIVLDKSDSDWDRQGVQRIIMSDDGNGAKVTIPSILISKEDGVIFKNWMNENSEEKSPPVVIELEWSLPQHKVVSVDFWTDSGNTEGAKFLRDFAPYAKALKGHLKFNVRYNIFSLPVDSAKLCVDGHPEFCADAPDSSGKISKVPIYGRDVVYEDLRQMCIFNVTAKSTSTGGPLYSDAWWKYMYRYPEDCPLDGSQETSRFGSVCSYRLMSHLGIDQNAVKRCEKLNWVSMLTEQKNEKAWSVLALRINGIRFAGSLDPFMCAKAACTAFETAPSACKSLSYMTEPGHTGISTGWFILIAFLCASLIVGGVYIYQQYLRRTLRASLRHEVMLEVKSQMEDYHQLDDENDYRRGR
eukprot:GHVO01032843.1.p2 GENE.GHVO01032843.1~~GHVO01032843.1.p2  ORF type:complete len:475 (+),score=72.65 GHVO01032843.1:1634-3058(+)